MFLTVFFAISQSWQIAVHGRVGRIVGMTEEDRVVRVGICKNKNRQQALLPIHCIQSTYVFKPRLKKKTKQGAASVWQFCTIQPSSLYGRLCEWLDTQSTYIQPIRANAAQRFSGGLRRCQSSELAHLQRTTYSFYAAWHSCGSFSTL